MRKFLYKPHVTLTALIAGLLVGPGATQVHSALGKPNRKTRQAIKSVRRGKVKRIRRGDSLSELLSARR